jgi:hypothetical protein
VEALLFPHLYLNWGGGFVESGKEFESVDGEGWFEYEEKKTWNVNPLFRI